MKTSSRAFVASALAVFGALPASAQGADVVDAFHPDNQPDANGVRPEAPQPVYGGRVIVHLLSLPASLNNAIENSAVTRRLHYEVHETLLAQDWVTHEYVPSVCERFEREDMLVLSHEAATRYPAAVRVRVLDREQTQKRTQREADVLYGRVSETAAGYRVEPLSQGSALAETLLVPSRDVHRLERGAVYTFHLRKDVLWHPTPEVSGHAFDAHDVLFSWKVFANPHVDADEKRFKFEKVTRADLIDGHTIRFFYDSQYFAALPTLGVGLTLLPSHVYDLSDPDNPDFKERFSAVEQGEFINTHPCNAKWVGLGPYRVSAFNDRWIEAQRFDDYFDPERGGYVDTIRWRYIADDDTALAALLDGELDFFERLRSADYFGAVTARESFTERLYKGYKSSGVYSYVCWNLYHPALQDPVVRRAIAHAFDFEGYGRTVYRDLCEQVTGSFPLRSPCYDASLEPYPFAPDAADEMLDDAGWYDSDGDGVRERDGVALEIELMLPAGNASSRNVGLKLQESLAAIGIKLTLAQFEWATFMDRLRDREYDAAHLARVPEFESDPEQLWHSKWGAYELRSSNQAGLRDEEVDRLIQAGQLELDARRRYALWHRMQRRLYELQPFLFLYNVPNKYGLSKRIRGFQTFAQDPGYSLRRWHFVSLDEPGTRPARKREGR